MPVCWKGSVNFEGSLMIRTLRFLNYDNHSDVNEKQPRLIIENSAGDLLRSPGNNVRHSVRHRGDRGCLICGVSALVLLSASCVTAHLGF